MTDALNESQAFWDAHAARDPLWAVLSDPGKEGRKWDVQRFLQTGLNELALVFYELNSHGIRVTTGTALDFGCGVGRLTQALAPRFDRVVGVDVSSGMVETARTLNHFPDRVSYVWNPHPDLRLFGNATFDFIYSNLVLQHIAPALTHMYLREFVRLLRPAGILVFQLPSHERSEHEAVPAPVATPMPDEAYRAGLALEGLPRTLAAGVPFTLDVSVTNTSQIPWSFEDYGAITIGNHWWDTAGERMLRRDDGRTPLPRTLAPGGTCWVPLTINPPSVEGEYQCDFDLAHEGVRWFEDRGSKVVRRSVAVRRERDDSQQTETEVLESRSAHEGNREASASPQRLFSVPAPGDPNAPDPGEFPMYGVPSDAVVQLIATSGAELLLRRDDPSCGPRWVSYRYFVREHGGRNVG